MRVTRPTLERLTELFTWDLDTGQMWWRVGRGRAAAGAVAGRLNRCGYQQVSIDCVCIPVHQAIYFLSTGEWVRLIDHINGKRADNRISNLRAATRADNARNRTNWIHRKLLGAQKHAYGWAAAITADGVHYHLGVFKTEEEAHEVYCKARKRCSDAEKAARTGVLEEMQAERNAA